MKRLTPPRMATVQRLLAGKAAQTFLDLQCQL
jgi:hypothetical protein